MAGIDCDGGRAIAACPDPHPRTRRASVPRTGTAPWTYRGNRKASARRSPERASSNALAPSPRGTLRGPVLPSGRRIAACPMSHHRRSSTSPRRQPVSASRRIAATASGHSASRVSRARPNRSSSSASRNPRHLAARVLAVAEAGLGVADAAGEGRLGPVVHGRRFPVSGRATGRHYGKRPRRRLAREGARRERLCSYRCFRRFTRWRTSTGRAGCHGTRDAGCEIAKRTQFGTTP